MCGCGLWQPQLWMLYISWSMQLYSLCLRARWAGADSSASQQGQHRASSRSKVRALPSAGLLHPPCPETDVTYLCPLALGVLCTASSMLGTDVPHLFSHAHHLFNPQITLNLLLLLLSQPDEDLFNPDYVEVDRILEVAHTKDPDTGEVSGCITHLPQRGREVQQESCIQRTHLVISHQLAFPALHSSDPTSGGPLALG